MKYNRKPISRYFKEESNQFPEMMMREAFLQTAVDLLDMGGIDEYSVLKLQGAVMMLEKFAELNDDSK